MALTSKEDRLKAVRRARKARDKTAIEYSKAAHLAELAGNSYQEIADAAGINKGAAFRLVNRYRELNGVTVD